MAYQALYRKWRPQSFADIVGQSAVTQTLKNALMHQKLSHAYLFTGPRGTGKTSAAKIVAKAINCLHQTAGEPCNQCELCQAITAGTLGDVIEIDAASNNGVEEIRDIRDKARYAPTRATYKVYIIDEVHMLSTGAFNALLKTLEEPPQNVLFILATTEPHKIPSTIISRTQRFDFRRITNEDIRDRLAYILEQENILYEENALLVIARLAKGGMRDALSMLDQVISFGDGTVSYEQTVQVSGSLTAEAMQQYCTYLIKKDTSSALILVQTIIQAGKEATRFVEEMIEFARDVLVQQQVKDPHAYQPAEQLFIDTVEPTFLYQFIDALHRTQQEMRFTTNPIIPLEVLTIKMSQQNTHSQAASLAVTVDETVKTELEQLQQQVAQLQQALQNGDGQLTSSANRETAQTSSSTPVQTTTYKVNLAMIYQILGEATKQDLTILREVWQDLLSGLTVTQRAILKAAEPVAASQKGFVLKFDYEILCQRAETSQELKQAVLEHSRRLIQYEGEFVCVPKEQWPTIRQEFILEKRKNQSEESASLATTVDESHAIDAHSEEHAFEAEPASPVDQLIEDTISLFGEEIIQVQSTTE